MNQNLINLMMGEKEIVDMCSRCNHFEVKKTKRFYSICSAHQVPDEACPLCKIGHWVDEEDDKLDE